MVVLENLRESEAGKAMEPAAKPDKSRNGLLDAIRGIAVMLVLGAHSYLPPLDYPEWLRMPLIWLKREGWVGVDIFLVLSGYLVTGLLCQNYLRSGRSDSGRFLLRRAFKIYPSFYLFVLVVWLLKWKSEGGVPWDQLLAEVLFVQNYHEGMMYHTWSLALEEHFYLFIAAAAWFFLSRRRAPRELALVLIGLVIAPLVFRIITNAVWPFAYITHYKPTHLRIDGLAIGALIAYVKYFKPALLARILRSVTWRWSLAALVLLGAVAALAIPESVFVRTIGFSLTSLAAGMLILVAMKEPELAWIRPVRAALGILAKIGESSYNIYLWHLPVFFWSFTMLRKLGVPDEYEIRTVAYVGGSIALGVLMTKIWEAPILKIRDRLVPR